MKFYFDTEFTQLRKETTLISVGILSEDYSCSFYAELTDFNQSLCDDWINKNVIDNCIYISRKGKQQYIFNRTIESSETNNISICGNREEVSKELVRWLSRFSEIQFVADVCNYDFVLLIDLITNGGTAFDLPAKISPYCHDINQDIADFLSISDSAAFDVNREELALKINPYLKLNEKSKHNALYDARMCAIVYKSIK